MAIFKGRKAGDDTFRGGDENDRFVFSPADLTSGDVVVGRRGVDTLAFTAAGTIPADALQNVRGIERIQLAAGPNDLTLTDALVASATGARVVIQATSGNERVDASALTGGNAVRVDAGVGDDTLLGGAGADVFDFTGGTLTEADVVVGGAGRDTIILDQAVVTAEMLANVQAIEVLKLDDTGVKIQLAGTLLTTADEPVRITGGRGEDEIDVSQVVRDPIQAVVYLDGGAGDDVIQNATGVVGDWLSIISIVDGGAGADTVNLVGSGRATVVYDRNDVLAAVTGGRLVVRGAANIDLSLGSDQSLEDVAVVRGFTDVDASASRAAVRLTGTGSGTLIGGGGADVIANARFITGGAGADTMVGTQDFIGSTFTVNAADFVRGEWIEGRSENDRLVIMGDADLTEGSVRGIDELSIGGGASGTPTVTIGADQIEDLDRIYGAGDLIIRLSGRGEFQLGRVTNQISDAVSVTVAGTDRGDRIDVATALMAVTVEGGGGDDVVSATIDSERLDGGQGVDTLRLAGSVNPIVIDLSLANQGVEGVGDLAGFENVDLRALGGTTRAVVRGSADANVIVGSYGETTIFGAGGDDVLSGGGYFSAVSILDGGAGIDVLNGTGENSRNTMTGGAGSDVFQWLFRSSSAMFDSLDVVTDFKSGQDRLVFARDRFDITGDAFDSRVVIRNTGADVTGADLVIYTGGVLDSAQDVARFISEVTNGDESGFFIAGTNSAGHAVLYHTLAGESGWADRITAIADLGERSPAQLILSDFGFI